MPAPIISVSETHQRTVRAQFDRFEVIELLAQAAINQANMATVPVGADVKVTFEDATEGSPAYKVGTKATVVITIDLAPTEACLSGDKSDS